MTAACCFQAALLSSIAESEPQEFEFVAESAPVSIAAEALAHHYNVSLFAQADESYGVVAWRVAG